MKKITFEKLTTQNFLSVGNETISIDFQDGFNLIVGKNIDSPERANGSGKSSVIEAYYYALFGTTIRDIKKEFCLNNITRGEGKIQLTFKVQTDSSTNSYRIERTLKPSTVKLIKLGDIDEDISKDSITNTNKYICELIGSNPTICKSCDILSLSDNIPFMAKKPEEKRKFIEDIFSLEIFGKMLKELKENIKDNKSDLSISVAKKEEIENSITSQRKQYDLHKKQSEERSEILNNRKSDLNNKILKTEEDFINLKELIIDNGTTLEEEKEKLSSAIDKINKRLSSLSTDLSIRKAEYSLKKKEQDNTLRPSSGVVCPECLQLITGNHVAHLSELRRTLTEEMGEIHTKICLIEIDMNSLSDSREKISTKLILTNTELQNNIFNCKKLIDLEISLKDFKRQLADIDQDIGLVEDNLTSMEEYIQETEKRKEEEELNYSTFKQKTEDYETCKFILGEEGVKSFIIKRLLDMLNRSIQKYITKLGMTMRCKFDEYFEEQITNEKGKNISYWNFSGGERRTVDIACAWAFKDIKRKISGISSNVEFLDEILDSAFDERGVDLLIEVIKERIEANSMSCYTISHRKETLKHIDGEIVNLEKENGITRRII